MKKLWSPWRSQYIDSFHDKQEKSGCIFCKAKDDEAGNEGSLLLKKCELSFAVLNLFPYNNGHLMVVPYRHLNNITLLTPEENSEIMKEIQFWTSRLEVVFNPDGFNIGANLGKASGAGIDDHIHFHIVPRWNGDTNFMPVLGEVKVISQDLLRTKARLLGVQE
ncbi:MAG TPA: HIT domain-containing protein [Ignavibacteriaceae bacterium]|nr:HIT domain-containing protein [Ignavibacteriaceae bacterium]